MNLEVNILVFEYITGGGLAQEELPKSLAREGGLMLKTLIDELAVLPSVKLTVLLDQRCNALDLPQTIEIIWVSAEHSVYDLLPALIEASDLVWPIAPEMESQLLNVSKLVEDKSKRLLNSSSESIAICSDKLATLQILQKNSLLPIIDARQLDEFSQQFIGPWVIKPKDGVGCLDCFFVSGKTEFNEISKQIKNQSNYLIQPYIKGESLSLSCLFKNGVAWLLCCNKQLVSIKLGKFELNACQVNIAIKNRSDYQYLINQVAQAIPGLWGYVGIDIIQPERGQALIVEINPRLTTSYAGIHQALGINVAEVVLKMMDKDPELSSIQNHQITISI
jgi:predicted ATP-grasp superfamily ATP-dependent carboligase